MLFSLILLFIISILNANTIKRVSVSTVYNITLSDDVMGCATDINNISNIVLNLYVASSGNNVFCVTDEGGFAETNNIQLNAAENDLFYPGGFGQYYIAANYKTSCFYSDGIASWVCFILIFIFYLLINLV